eukprot:NODE_489_length_6860_cov_1.209289.p1 type:complete len:580 gc:universal NODE_489_length_6860_cov_1.209289:2350-4089(+)
MESQQQKPVSFTIENTPKGDKKGTFGQGFGQTGTTNAPSTFKFGDPAAGNTINTGNEPSKFSITNPGTQPSVGTNNTSGFAQTQPSQNNFGFGQVNNPPAFGQSNNTSTPAFGQTNTSAASTFGQNNSTNPTSQPPSFSFGQGQVTGNSQPTTNSTSGFGLNQSKPSFAVNTNTTNQSSVGQTSNTSGSFSFGKNSTSSAPQTAPPTLSTNLSFSKPGEQATAQTIKPSTGFNFAQPSASSNQPNSAFTDSTKLHDPPKPTTFQFNTSGTNKTETNSKPGAFQFNTTSASQPSTDAPKTTGFSLGGNAGTGFKLNMPTSSNSATQPKTTDSTTPAPTSFGFNVGIKPTQPSQSAPDTTQPTTAGFKLNTSTAPVSGAANTNKKVSFAPDTKTSAQIDTPLHPNQLNTPQPLNQQGMNNMAQVMNTTSHLEKSTLDQILQKWTHDLNVHKQQFHSTCEQIRQHDQQLIQNHKSLYDLNKSLKSSHNLKGKIEMDLEYLEGEQMALMKQIDQYDQLLVDLLKKDGIQLDAEITGNASQGDTQRFQGLLQVQSTIHKLNELDTETEQLMKQVNTVDEKDPVF